MTVLGALLGAPAVSFAQDATGLWASQPEACDTIFVKEKGRMEFAATADFHGSGFIIEGDLIRGKTATCKVRKKVRKGSLATITATCTSDVMVGESTFQLRTDEPTTIVRIVPGLPELDTKYFRCPPK